MGRRIGSRVAWKSYGAGVKVAVEGGVARAVNHRAIYIPGRCGGGGCQRVFRLGEIWEACVFVSDLERSWTFGVSNDSATKLEILYNTL